MLKTVSPIFCRQASARILFRRLAAYVFATTAFVSATLHPARAASIKIVHSEIWEEEEPKCNVLMKGRIEHGDFETLKEAYKTAEPGRKMSPSYLCLDSPGGNLTEALAIADWLVNGDGIGIATVIGDGAECSSSCALIFLSGSRIDHNVYGYAPQAERWLHVRGRLELQIPYAELQTDVSTELKGEELVAHFHRAMKGISRIFQKRQVFDTLRPARTEWVRSSLLHSLLLNHPSESVRVDTIDAAGRWGIKLLGLRPLHRSQVTEAMARTACRNALYWQSDLSALGDEMFFDGELRNVGIGEYGSRQWTFAVGIRHFESSCVLSVSESSVGLVDDIAAEYIEVDDGKIVGRLGLGSSFLYRPSSRLSELIIHAK